MLTLFCPGKAFPNPNPLLESRSPRMPNRTLVIGDIHGCSDALRALLDVIQPDSGDTIITLGDYVDRGPDSAGVLEVLTELISVCTLVPLLGNHELMLGNALNSRREFEFWLFNGGKSTVQSYGGDMNNMPLHHRTFLKYCKRYHETDSHIFLHAAYDAALPMHQQPDELLFWQHVDEHFLPGVHESGKTVICGHTPQASGEILDLGHIRIVDTFCYGDKWLTALDVDSGEFVQARTDGGLREGFSRFSGNGTTQRGASGSVSPPVTSLPGEEPSWQRKWPFTERRPSPLEMDGNTFRQISANITSRLAQVLDNLEQYPVCNNPPRDWSVDELMAELDEPLPSGGNDAEEILDRFFGRYVPTSFNTASHGYLAYIPGGGIPDAALADLMSGITNRFVTVWQAAPAMAKIESTVIRWFNGIMGMPEGSGGYLTTGGSQANLSALIVARTCLLGEDFLKGRIYASSQAHHCVPKAAFMAGFPRDALRVIPVNDDYSMDVQALQRAIAADRAAGYQPLMVVASAGTTNTGSVDDLVAIRQSCDRENLWMHVDGAYGGFFALTETGQAVLQGIGLADSIALDPHKGMFLPYGTGCLLVRRRDDLLKAFQYTSEYMPPMTSDPQREDFCEISPELSRSNRGLRIWWPVKCHGIDVFRTLLQEKLDLTQWACQQMVELGDELADRFPGCRLEIVVPPVLSVFAFRLVRDADDQAAGNELNRRWLEQINRRGSVMMTSTLLEGRLVLRICVLSFRTHIDRMEMALADIGISARQVLSTQGSGGDASGA